MEPIYEKCPKCGTVGRIDPDQAPPDAATSIGCSGCGYHYQWIGGKVVPK